MNKIPLLEKYKYCNDVEVIKIAEFEFVIKEINHIQSNYLHNYTEYFFNNPETFIPFLEEIIINKEVLDKFINNEMLSYIERKNRILNLINAICVQCLSISPLSFDYTLANEIKSISENNLIINRFISVLISYGYKKSEINNFSNKKIIQLSLEEMWIRSRSETIIFIGEIISAVTNYEKQLPISFDEFNSIYNYWKDKIKFYSDEVQDSKARFEFNKNINNLFNKNVVSENKSQHNYSKKSLTEIKAEQEEIQRQRKLLNSLPK